jgi:hypothetical protein
MLKQHTGMDAIPAATAFGPADTFVAIIQARENLADGTARIPDRSRSGATDYKAEYLWLDAGQSWPFLRRFETISERALCGWLFVVVACSCWALIMMMTDGTRPEEATLQMERLAQKLESTAAIPAATAIAVARAIGQPWYDCRHVACSADLADRNLTVRTRLENLLAPVRTRRRMRRLPELRINVWDRRQS